MDSLILKIREDMTINISVQNHPRWTLTSICRTGHAPTYSSFR